MEEVDLGEEEGPGSPGEAAEDAAGNETPGGSMPEDIDSVNQLEEAQMSDNMDEGVLEQHGIMSSNVQSSSWRWSVAAAGAFLAVTMFVVRQKRISTDSLTAEVPQE